jgi:membrane associated rhomboid family serine protease
MTYYGSRSYGRSGLDAVWYLIIVNGIVFAFTFLMEIINGYFFNVTLLPLIALVPGQLLIHPWTLVTHMFVHANIYHILSNMLALYFFGEFLYQIVGERKFFLIYFLGGICGGLFFVLFAYTLGPGLQFVPAVGASGAVYALGGALAVLRPNARVMIFPFPVPIPLWLAVVIGLLLVAQGVAWQAHLGGALFGALMGLMFLRQKRNYL